MHFVPSKEYLSTRMRGIRGTIASILALIVFPTGSAIGTLFVATALANDALDSAPPATVVQFKGNVFYLRDGKTKWIAASACLPMYPADRLSTAEDATALIEIADYSRLRLQPRSELTLTPPNSGTDSGRIELNRGLLYFLHRNGPGTIEVGTPVGNAAIEGTEFILSVDESDSTTQVQLIDGRVTLQNEQGSLLLHSGESGIIERGKAPRRTAVIEGKSSIQWWLYYPGVVDPEQLGRILGDSPSIQPSLSAYKLGDLHAAFSLFPTNKPSLTPGEKLYFTTLQFSKGLATQASVQIQESPTNQSISRALTVAMAAVRGEAIDAQLLTAADASHFLSLSYYFQSRGNLAKALESATNAAKLSPHFGFAWHRVAELEFSFGRTPAAKAALKRSIELAPRNAQASALEGFLHLASSDFAAAESSFNRAIQIDPLLGNGWLGRGLSRLRTGKIREGRADLETAVLAEPGRALLRSYLGKAFSHEASFAHGATNHVELRRLALDELALSAKLDPADPTPWLYRALLNYEGLRLADSIADLETSQRLNTNRAIYRSRLLLDQDQSVRSANLARVYADAAMLDVAFRESARAVSYDYGNYSAHLNLAAAYDELRDPTRFNLRYESDWFNEHLLASLLAKSGSVSLSQNLSQQEYSRLFASDRLAFSSTTSYLGTGDVRETVSQIGQFGGTSFALDLDYQHNHGERINNRLERIEWYTRIKQQFTPEDSVLVLVKYQDYDSGDNFQYLDQAKARPSFQYSEFQAPLLLLGWHHEWAPGNHTLLLGGRLVNSQRLSDTNAPQPVAVTFPLNLFDPFQVPMDVAYESRFEIYSAELNQIIQREAHTDILGTLIQAGKVSANSTESSSGALAQISGIPALVGSIAETSVGRFTAYAYHHWSPFDQLLLIGGVTYDAITYPDNFRRPPLDSGRSTYRQVSPKAAMLWDASSKTRIRGMYAQAVGGISFDESIRLEPHQLVGFSQSFRSLISESLAGDLEAPRYELLGAAIDHRLRTNSWISLQADSRQQTVEQRFGLFNATFSLGAPPPANPAQGIAQLGYQEHNVRLIANQILGPRWFLEEQVRYSHSRLNQTWPDITATSSYARTQRQVADLVAVEAVATWQHPSGIFLRGEISKEVQWLDPRDPLEDRQSLPTINLFAGYRFPNHHADLTVGVLNLCDADYHLSPLSFHAESPHRRTFYTRVRFSF